MQLRDQKCILSQLKIKVPAGWFPLMVPREGSVLGLSPWLQYLNFFCSPFHPVKRSVTSDNVEKLMTNLDREHLYHQYVIVILLVPIWSLHQLYYLFTHNSTTKYFSLFITTASGKLLSLFQRPNLLSYNWRFPFVPNPHPGQGSHNVIPWIFFVLILSPS